MSRFAAQAGLTALAAAALFALASRAEMVRAGEARFEDLAPPGGEPILASAQAPIPRSRTQMILSEKLKGASSRAPRYSLERIAANAKPDPELGDVIADLRYWRDARYGRGGQFTQMRDFLARRGHWPALERLRKEFERAMPEKWPPQKRLDYFGRFEPLTARGARLLAEAKIALGDQKGGEAQLIAAWSTLPATRKEEKVYLKRYGALLEPHHKARMEKLIWRRELTAAQRLSKNIQKQIGAEWSKLMEALTTLHRSGKGVSRKIKRVPDALRTHPSLLHGLMVWRERKRRREDAEQALRAASLAGDLGDPAAWAAQRMRFARDAYEDGRPEDAAALAGPHGLSEGGDFANLEWFAGWMRLGHLDEPKEALEHFTRLWEGVRTPISRSRAAYWASEAAAAAGDERAAQRWRERAAAFPDAFYGQLAAEELSIRPDVRDDPALSDPFKASSFDREQRDLWAAANALYIGESNADAKKFMLALAERRHDPASIGWLARRARANSDFPTLIELSKRAFDIGAPHWSGLYPIPDTPRFAGRRTEPALLLAIARQESRFRRVASSRVGATGLMQLMPATAKAAARRLSLPYRRAALNQDMDYNLTLADAHLQGEIDHYGGSYVLAIAAYNAGGGNVAKWLKRFGDPREPDMDPIQWIESIPFYETRNYVQRVLESTEAYRIRLGQTGRLRLREDLERGKKKS